MAKESNKQTTARKPRKKMTKRSIVNAICVIFLSLLVIGSTVTFALVQNVLSNSEIMNKIDGLTSDSSSIIYDDEGKEFATLSGGSGVRENISYDEIPQVVIDAFLSIEDSRFFKHNGFDLPRFIKSGMANVTSGSIVQGGSTLTMQLIDVRLFNDENATEIKQQSTIEKLEQKLVEIFKSMDVESKLDKKTIMEYYLNSINFGGAARGIEKGAQYYFGKEAKNLTLSEAAFLAGVINAPGAYNPYNVDESGTSASYLERATQRRNQVLSQMLNHGYISENEYYLARSSKLSLQLNGASNFDTEAYQSYIDAVIEEVREKTGKDPYTTPMKIYTSMDREAQEIADSILNGEVVEFPDERMTTGFTALDNQTGEIKAIGGGRSYGGDVRMNHGTMVAHQIGSTAKPLMEYVLSFEDLGYSTEHVFADTPVDNYTADGQTMYNADRQFHGDVTFKDAVGNSYNIPAYKTFLAVRDAIGESKMIDFYHKIGWDMITSDNFSAGMSIGGAELAMTTEELAGGYAILANSGNYIEPHTVVKIDFENKDIEDYEADYESVSACSEESAYLMSYILRNNITAGYNTIKGLSGAPYAIYAKSGTTDAPAGLAIPEGSSKDKWMVAYTNRYTVATWLGYEEYMSNPNNYFDESKLYLGIEGAITRSLLDNLSQDGSGDEIARPAGVVNISHIQGLFPYATSSSGGNMVTGLIRSKYAKTESTIAPDELSSLSDFNITLENNTLTMKYSKYPKEEALSGDNGEITVKAGGVTFKYKPKFSKAQIFGAVRYFYDIYINGNLVTNSFGNNESITTKINSSGGDEVKVCGYYAYEKDKNTKSNQICKTLTSDAQTKYKIGSDFEAIFNNTNDFNSAVNAVQIWAAANIPGVQLNYLPSNDVSAGKLDTNKSTIAVGMEVNGGLSYNVYIGQ